MTPRLTEKEQDKIERKAALVQTQQRITNFNNKCGFRTVGLDKDGNLICPTTGKILHKRKKLKTNIIKKSKE